MDKLHTYFSKYTILGTIVDINFVFISVYVDIGTEASGTATLAFAFDGASTNRKYDIKVAQIPCGTSYA